MVAGCKPGHHCLVRALNNIMQHDVKRLGINENGK